MKKISLSILAVSAAISVSAQVTTSSLSGTVLDKDNGPIIGAGITLTHIPTNTTYYTNSLSGGNFSIEGIRAGGPYQLTVEYNGYNNKIINNINTSLGETFDLKIKLEEISSANILENVVVKGNLDPVLNSNRTGAATNINNQTISKLPTINRSLTDITRLTPQSNGNGFAGRDGRYNNLQVDGANFNNAFGLSNNPLPGGSNQPISLDAIEAVSINIAPYDVRQTGFTGAGINAITRSGTNDIEGSAYGYFRPKSFTGLNVGKDTLSKAARNQNQILGVRLGAPIVKNKLFFFGSFEYENSKSAGNLWVANNGTNNSASNTTRVLESDLKAVQSFLKNTYGYDPGAYQGYANNYLNSNIKGLIRLDWNINDNHKFTIRYNTMTGTSDQGTNATSGPTPRLTASRIGSSSMVFENSNYKFKNSVSSITAELNSKFTNKLSNQFLATYSRIQDTRVTPGGVFPFVDILKDSVSYISLGTELFSSNNDVINDNISITNNITYNTGAHNITAGLSFQSMAFGNSFRPNGSSYYRYYDINNFLAGGKPDMYATTYLYDGQDGYARVKFGLIGVYTQDKFTVNRRFNITGGIRVDKPLFFNQSLENPAIEKIALLNTQGDSTYYSTKSWPKSRLLISPRVGFNYDVMGDRSIQVRGGTGVFTGNIPFVWFTNMPTNSGMIQNTFNPVNASLLAKITRLEKDPLYWPNMLPNDFPKVGGQKAPGQFALIDNKFRMPRIWRTNLGTDIRIPNTPLVATIDVIYSKDLVAVYQFNANRKPAAAKLNFENDKRDLWVDANDARFNSSTNGIIPVLSNTDKGYSFATTLGLTLKETKGFNGSLFYTYSNAKDVTSNPGSQAASAWSNNYSINDPNELLLGYSQYAIPHRVVGNVGYRIEYAKNFATTISLFYNGANQGRFAYTYSNDLNKDGVNNDILYVPNDISKMKFKDIMSSGNVLFSADAQRKAFEAFITSNGLDNYKGTYVDRNSGLMPWLNRWDARVMQDIFYTMKNGRRHTLQLSLDIMNLGNLLNKEWGLLKQLNNGSDFNYGLLKSTGISADGVPTFEMITVKDAAGKTVLPTSPFRNLYSTASTWGMQFGVRYIF